MYALYGSFIGRLLNYSLKQSQQRNPQDKTVKIAKQPYVKQLQQQNNNVILPKIIRSR